MPEPRAMTDRQTDRTSPLRVYADLTRRTVTFLSSLFRESNLEHTFPVKLDKLQGKDDGTPR